MTNKKNLHYIAFVLVVIFFAVLFFSSRTIFGDDRKRMTENYDMTVLSIASGYQLKVTNARYDVATNTLYADFYLKGKPEVKEYPPELVKVTVGDINGKELKFKVSPNPEREFASVIQIDSVPKDFYWIRLYIKTKAYDTKNPDTIDEFGNVIKHPDTPGKQDEIWVSVDHRNASFYDSSKGEKPKAQASVEITDSKTDTDSNATTTTQATTTKPSQTTTNGNVSSADTPKQPAQVTTSAPTKNLSQGNNSPQQTTTSQKVNYNTPGATTQAPAPAQTAAPPPVTNSTTATTKSNSPPVLINAISLSNYSNIVLSVNQTCTVAPSILPANATNKNLTWVTSKPLVAVVDSNGVITAKGYGKAIITCWTTDGTNLSASCMVTVG